MKKRLLSLIIGGFCFSNISAQTKTINNTPFITQLNDSTVIITGKAIVPPNNIFKFYYPNGKVLGTFTSGQTINWVEAKKKDKALADAIKKLPKPENPQNCFKVACPSGAPAGAVCWDCK